MRLDAIAAWRLEGKVGIRHSGRLWASGLDWTHAQELERMNLLSPGGRVLVHLQGGASGASARDSKGQVYRAATFEQLAAEVIGVEVPVSSLRYWVLGAPDPAVAAETLRIDGNGRVESFSQRGWQVRYMAYRPTEVAAVPSIDLPLRLVLMRDDLKITFVVHRWRRLQLDRPGKQRI